MHYAPQILLCCAAWISVVTSAVAKEPLDPELLKKYTKDVESVLSPTLVEELQGAQSNRSAINVEQTAPRNPEPPTNVDDKKPDIQFDNQVYPYHYERSYHYQYPPTTQHDPSRPFGYSEHFYEPRFRPKSHVTDNHDPAYYRSDPYSSFGTSSNRNPNSNLQASSNTNENTAVNGNGKQADISRPIEPYTGPTPLPPSSFAHTDTLASPPPANPFPNVDLGGYRHSVFSRPLGPSNYYRPSGEPGQRPKDPPGHYLPQADIKYTETFHHRPVGSYEHLPPLDSFQNYPPKEFQSYSENRPPLPDSSSGRSQNLPPPPPPPPPFLGSFFPSGYPSPFHGYRPSEHFNSLFSDNFTRSFPPRPAFGGFYPNHHYLPPPPSPSPSANPENAQVETKLEEPVPTAQGLSSQPISTAKQEDPAPVAAASNTHYEVKLFFPAKDHRNQYIPQPRISEELTYITDDYRL